MNVIRQLPPRPNLEHLKNEAKQRFRELREGDPSIRLAIAQLALAREYGFASWRKLKAHVDSVSGAGELPNPWAKDLPERIAAAHRRGDLDEVERTILTMLGEHPDDADLTAIHGAFTLHFRLDPAAAKAIYDRLLKRPTAAGLAHYASFLGMSGEATDDEVEAMYRRAVELGEPNSPQLGLALSNYACFLEYVRGDVAAAERNFRRAASMEPRYARVKAVHLGQYAEFQWRHGNCSSAEEAFRRSRAISANESRLALTFAVMLTATGRAGEGLALVPEVLTSWWLPTLSDPVPVELVCWFLLYAHGTPAQQVEALPKLKSLLRAGRHNCCLDSPGLRRNGAVAAASGHSAAGLVSTLAEILSVSSPSPDDAIADLDRFPVWHNS
jgi:tetratricopeptide (TPR) repeat protein